MEFRMPHTHDYTFHTRTTLLEADLNLSPLLSQQNETYGTSLGTKVRGCSVPKSPRNGFLQRARVERRPPRTALQAGQSRRRAAGRGTHTCSAGKRCSLSSSAASGISSFSAKSRHVWRSIWCVSGSSTVWYTVCSRRRDPRARAEGGQSREASPRPFASPPHNPGPALRAAPRRDAASGPEGQRGAATRPPAQADPHTQPSGSSRQPRRSEAGLRALTPGHPSTAGHEQRQRRRRHGCA